MVLAAPGAVEAGERIERAGDQFATEHVALHGGKLSTSGQ